MAAQLISALPIRAVRERDDDGMRRGTWPSTVPAVQQVLDHGLELGPATVIVGENGSGKSTLVEGIAMAFGLSAEGGSPSTMHETRRSESPLGDHLLVERGAGAPRFGYFLRAETMHGLYTYLEQHPPRSGADLPFHELSHGESFLALVGNRFRDQGLWVLDEPESALSFAGCLALLTHLTDLLRHRRNQVVLSTHSPLLAALPGADLYAVGEWGLRRSTWADTDLVRTWATFFEDPERFLRHLAPAQEDAGSLRWRSRSS